MTSQLALELYQKRGADFGAFVGTKNVEAISALKEWSRGENENTILIWAKKSLGKSHALQAAVREATEKVSLQCMFLCGMSSQPDLPCWKI